MKRGNISTFQILRPNLQINNACEKRVNGAYIQAALPNMDGGEPSNAGIELFRTHKRYFQISG